MHQEREEVTADSPKPKANGKEKLLDAIQGCTFENALRVTQRTRINPWNK
jgi:hypothetical protein